MVNGQIRPNRVTNNALIAALNTVPRERFVPKGSEAVAYLDGAISVGGGRALLEPMVFARLLQEAAVSPQDKVLDVGCATGYSTAILAQLAASVVAVESDAALASFAKEAVAPIADSAVVVQGALADGHAASGPYDLIVLGNGAVGEVPEALFAQLAEGGRLIAIIVQDHPIARVGQVRIYRKVGGSVSSTSIFETMAPILPGFAPKSRFVF